MDVEESSSSTGCVEERRRRVSGVALGWCGTDRAAVMEVGTKARAAGASTSAVPNAKRAGFVSMVALNAVSTASLPLSAHTSLHDHHLTPAPACRLQVRCSVAHDFSASIGRAFLFRFLSLPLFKY